MIFFKYSIEVKKRYLQFLDQHVDGDNDAVIDDDDDDLENFLDKQFSRVCGTRLMGKFFSVALLY